MDAIDQLTAKYLDQPQPFTRVEERELAALLRSDPLAAQEFVTLDRQDRLLLGLSGSSDRSAIDVIMASVQMEKSTGENSFVTSVMSAVHDQAQPSFSIRAFLQNLLRPKIAWSFATVILLFTLTFYLWGPK